MSLWPFYIFYVWKNSLLKINIIFIINFERKKVLFSEAVIRNCSIRKIAHKILPKLTCNLVIKETPTQVYFCEFSKFLKKPILQNTCKFLVLDFKQFYVSHSIIHFIKGTSKKVNYYLSNVFNRISTSENYRQKKLDSKVQLFVTFFPEEIDLKSFIRAWELV